MRKNVGIILSLLLLLSFFLSACPSVERGREEEKKLRVVVTLFPLYDFARQVGGNKVDVSLLLPPGVEAHAFEPRPADITRIERAACLIFTGQAMEPWVTALLTGLERRTLTVIDTSRDIPKKLDRHPAGHPAARGHDHAQDPHIWLDFANAMTMVDTIARGFAALDPQNRAFYAANAERYKGKLADLDRNYREALARCHGKVIVHAGHFVFGYLADRYNLTYVSAYRGFSPNAEPSPKMLAALIQTIRKYDVKAIYHEELVSPRVAEAVARETGLPLLMLHGAHNMTREEMSHGVTFVQLMEKNLENLRKGLQCP